jgi:hypothetical protein
MAKYLTRESAYIEGTYYAADPRNPAVITLADDAEPSLKFEPVDEAARAAIKALIVTKEAKAKEGPKPSEDLISRAKLELADTKDLKPVVSEDHPSMSEMQTRKAKRSSDRDAV